MGFSHVIFTFVALPIVFGLGFLFTFLALEQLNTFSALIQQHIRDIKLGSILVSFLLIFLSKIPVSAVQAFYGKKGYDNDHPRSQQNKISEEGGLSARLIAAHHNTIEAFAPFAAAVIVNLINALEKGPQASPTTTNDYLIAKLCILYIILRLVYLFAYASNLSTFRSVVWCSSFFIIVTLFLIPILGNQVPNNIKLINNFLKTIISPAKRADL